MSIQHSVIGLGLISLGLACPSYSAVTIGNPKSDTGALTLSGTLRANYQNKDYGEPSSDQKIKFDAAILRIGYESPDWFGKAEYRCYQYDTFCDFSTLVYGYAGYNFNETDNITLGLQPIPFGPSRFWDSSFYASINNTLGIQDVSNIGANYHFEMPTATKLDIGYFITDGSHYHGQTKDSARYTANFISSDDPLKTNLNEKNMWLARIDQDIKSLNIDGLKISVGGSYWYSEIENKKTSTEGTRNVWSLFNRINYKNLNVVLTAGKQSIDNKDMLSPKISGIGAFDSEYEIANDGYFYTADFRYSFNNINNLLNISPYIVFSGFNKKDENFDESHRNIIGLAWDYKNISLYTEYVMSKNDPFVGGSASSLGLGDDGKWNKLLNIMLVYNF